MEKRNYVPGENEPVSGIAIGAFADSEWQYFVLDDYFKFEMGQVTLTSSGATLVLGTDYELTIDTKYTKIEANYSGETLHSMFRLINSAFYGKEILVTGQNFGTMVDNEAMKKYIDDQTGSAGGCCAGSGACSARPILGADEINKMYFDTDYGHPVWWNGSDWVNATGASSPCEGNPPPESFKLKFEYDDGTPDTIVPIGETTRIHRQDAEVILGDGSSVSRLTIGDTMTTIDPEAFDSDGVSGVPAYANIDCELILPPSLVELDGDCFKGWNSFNHPLDLTYITGLASRVFINWFAMNSEVTLPVGITDIPDFTFYGWNSFNQEFRIPATVTHIGQESFSRWNSYDKTFYIDIELASSVAIENYVFDTWDANHPVVMITGGDSNINWKNAFTLSNDSGHIESINGILWDNIN